MQQAFLPDSSNLQKITLLNFEFFHELQNNVFYIHITTILFIHLVGQLDCSYKLAAVNPWVCIYLSRLMTELMNL